MEIEFLVTATKTTLALKKFIEEGGFSNFLSKIGDAELKAATKIFRQLDHCEDTKLAINRALSHLESADEYYYLIYANKDDLLTPNRVQYWTAKQNSFFVNCLIAISHLYLKDSPTIVAESLLKAYIVSGLMEYQLQKIDDCYLDTKIEGIPCIYYTEETLYDYLNKYKCLEIINKIDSYLVPEKMKLYQEHFFHNIPDDNMAQIVVKSLAEGTYGGLYVWSNMLFNPLSWKGGAIKEKLTEQLSIFETFCENMYCLSKGL